MESEFLHQRLELRFTVQQCAIQKPFSCAIERYDVMLAFADIRANEYIDGLRMSSVLHISLPAMSRQDIAIDQRQPAGVPARVPEYFHCSCARGRQAHDYAAILSVV